MSRTPAETPLQRFRAGDFVFVRAKVIGPGIDLQGQSAAAVDPCDSLGRSMGAVHYVNEKTLVSKDDVLRSVKR